jgi:tetratricopeptide (TPR) repeat protein
MNPTLTDTPEGILCELKPRDLFNPASVRKLQLTKAVGAVLAARPDSNLFEIQSIRFARSSFTREQAEAWVRENLMIQPGTIDAMAEGKVLPVQALNVSEAEQKVVALMGLAAIREGNLKRARKLFQGLIALNPLSNLAHMGMGKVLQAEGKPDAAMAEFKEALNLNPTDLESLFGSAEIHLKKGQKKAALPLLLQVVGIDRTRSEAVTAQAAEIVESQYTNDELKDFLDWGKGKVEQMAKERLKSEGKAVKTLSGAPTAAAAAAGIGSPRPSAAKPGVGPVKLPPSIQRA